MDLFWIPGTYFGPPGLFGNPGVYLYVYLCIYKWIAVTSYIQFSWLIVYRHTASLTEGFYGLHFIAKNKHTEHTMKSMLNAGHSKDWQRESKSISDYNNSIFFSRVADPGGVDPDPTLEKTFQIRILHNNRIRINAPYFRKRIKRKRTKIAPSVNPTLPSHSTLTGKVS